YESETTKEITNIMVSNSSEKLGTKLNSSDQGGFFAPGKLEFEDGKGPKEGTFKIYQDSSAVCRPETYTTFYGDTFDKIKNANPAVDKDKINEWLNTKIGSKTKAGNTFFDDDTVFSDLNGKFYINGVEIEIGDYKQLTPNELMAKVNGSGAGVTMTYDYEKNIFQISNNDGGAVELTLGNEGLDTSNFFEVFKVGLNSGATYVRGQNTGSLDTATVINKLDPSFTYQIKSGTFSINGVSIYVDITTDTINDVINKVNKSGAGVTMTYDSTTDKFSLTSTSGERIKVGGKNDTSTFLLSAGLLYSQATETAIGTEGKDAVFTMNGVKYTRDSNNVSDVVPGMSFTINSVGTTVFNVKIDTDKAVSALAEFASKYNTLINALNPTEIAYNDDIRDNYSEPLTDEKKASMSEDEIKTYQENYEKISYYDLVTRSSELKALKTNIRSALTKLVDSDNSKYSSITQIGITIAGSDTQDITVTKVGLLFDVTTDKTELEKYIKENSKFVSILSENPEDVYKFFADSKTVYTTDSSGKETSSIENVGFARVFSDFLDDNINSTSALYKKTSTNGTIESEISSLKEQVESQTTRVEMYLERLYSQFAAMEEKLSTLQQSSSYLTNLSSGSSS
ncbi:MAG: flagellar filament capping protein FliD, partial [Candidatus Mucispirillum faecigallinarum]|nr:flagellar filament capping protein FliD [Candidatus Mucispirillum faecigallinarum]